MLPCPLTKFSGEVQQPNPGRMTKDPDLSVMEVWITPGKEPKPAELLAEGE